MGGAKRRSLALFSLPLPLLNLSLPLAGLANFEVGATGISEPREIAEIAVVRIGL